MARATLVQRSFNGGQISVKMLGRQDVELMSRAGVRAINWRSQPEGGMRQRPGYERIATLSVDTHLRELVYESGEQSRATSIAALSAGSLSIYTDGAAVTRPAPATVTAGDFSTLTGWTVSTPSGTSATVSGGNLILVAAAVARPTARQQLTPASGATTIALRITVSRGPVLFRVGLTAGAEDVFGATALGTGVHDLSWPATGATWIELSSESDGVQRIVDSVAASPAGALALPTPWTYAQARTLSWLELGDRAYIGSQYQPRILERRAYGSWSLVLYEAIDGPYELGGEQRVSISASDTAGNVTLTASSALFASTHVGALFRIEHDLQSQTATIAGATEGTDSVRLLGNTGVDRGVYLEIAGTFVGTIKLQRSFATDGNWQDWSGYTFTAPRAAGLSAAATIDEDGRIVYVRAYVDTGGWTSGSALVTLSAKQGAAIGHARITAFASSTSVSAEVLQDLGAVDATRYWREGSWSDRLGWPRAPAEHDGRLIWAGGLRLDASVSDQFTSWDEEIDTDAAPIGRTIGGRASAPRWAMSLEDRVVVGSSTGIRTLQSSAYEEPITREQNSIRPADDVGCANVQATRVDDVVFYVDRGGRRPMTLARSDGGDRLRSIRRDFMTSGLFDADVVQIAVQRRPHTRLWWLLANGRLWSHLWEPSQEVEGFVEETATGWLFRSIAVEPYDDPSDRLWAVVEHEESGELALWRLAGEHEAGLDDLSITLDDCAVFRDHGSDTLTGLDRFNGELVSMWIDGVPIQPTEPIGGGVYVHDAIISQACVGRPTACYHESVPLAFGVEAQLLLRSKRVNRMGLVLETGMLGGLRLGVRDGDQVYTNADARWIEALQYAPDGEFDSLSLPLSELEGSGSTDARIIVQNLPPYPVGVCAYVAEIEA